MLINTSAWVEFLRRTGSPAALERAIPATAATTDVIMMGVLTGTTDPDRQDAWARALDGIDYLAQIPRDDAESAAALYRECRRAGETPRQLTDCLVAAVAIRCNVPVLHNDRDFEVLARHTALNSVSV